jgi:hypothetical protein
VSLSGKNLAGLIFPPDLVLNNAVMTNLESFCDRVLLAYQSADISVLLNVHCSKTIRKLSVEDVTKVSDEAANRAAPRKRGRRAGKHVRDRQANQVGVKRPHYNLPALSQPDPNEARIISQIPPSHNSFATKDSSISPICSRDTFTCKVTVGEKLRCKLVHASKRAVQISTADVHSQVLESNSDKVDGDFSTVVRGECGLSGSSLVTVQSDCGLANHIRKRTHLAAVSNFVVDGY